MFRSFLSYAKNRRENIFLLFLVGSLASELMWIIRIRNEREVIKTDTQTQLKLMDRIIGRLNKGEQVDIKHELMKKSSDDADYQDILDSIKDLDQKWREETSKAAQGETIEAARDLTASSEVTHAEYTKSDTSDPHGGSDPQIKQSPPLTLAELRAPQSSSSKFL